MSQDLPILPKSSRGRPKGLVSHQVLLLVLLVMVPSFTLARAGPEANPKPKAQNEDYSSNNNYDYGTDYGEENYGMAVYIMLFKICI